VKRFFRLLLVVILLAGLAAAGSYWYVAQPYKGYTDEEIFVEVPTGAGVNAIGRRLIDAGVIRDQWAFRLAMRLRGGPSLHPSPVTLRAGEYRFTEALTPSQVLDKLARGDVYLRPLTFPEGLTIAEMGAIYEKHGVGTAADFAAAAKDPSLIREIDPHASDLEGYLYPDTYALPRLARANEVVAQMVARFKEVYTPALRQEIAAKGLTVRQAVTLASIVEKETAKAEERPLVSAVYHNRLRIGMGLQCDPTVIYALLRAGRYTGNLTREDLRFDSPYNTYRYAGLPPGPIAAPGRPSLEAAARPASVTYLYFVSKNDGSHVFSSTLEEHNRNVREFQIQYFRTRRAAAAAATASSTLSPPTSTSVSTPRNTTSSSAARSAAAGRPGSRGRTDRAGAGSRSGRRR
jgi:UPF0755 protein